VRVEEAFAMLSAITSVLRRSKLIPEAAILIVEKRPIFYLLFKLEPLFVAQVAFITPPATI
jgi:hypothetical protein